MSGIGEKYRWVAYDNEGGSVSQVAASGQKNAFEDLPHTNLKSFELWDWQSNQRVLLVNFNKGDRLVWRRRIQMIPGAGATEVCHIVGKIAKNGEKGIIGIFESDGHVESVPDFLPNSEWFYPPASELKESDDDAGS